MVLVAENLYAGRTDAGGVRLVLLSAAPATAPNVGDVIDGALLDVTLSSDAWCAVVAEVSRLGNTDNRAYRAQLFHAGR
jgi:hypothetical protein